MRTRRFPGYAAAIAAAVVTLLWYLPAVQHDFVNWDDNIYVTENAHLLRLDPAFFRWAFVESRQVMWHPLTWISHALDVAVWGPNPAGHHLTSVALHALNTLLVGVLALKLLEAGAGKGRAGAGSRIIVPLVTSLLFGLHPIHVESVAWIAERKDVLSAFFSLGALLAYLRYLDDPEAGDRPGRVRFTSRRYLQCLGLFGLALMSKPSVVSLPLAMLVVDWHPMGRFSNVREARRALLEKIPFFVLGAAATLVALSGSNVGNLAREATGAPLDKVLLACHALMAYVGKLVWPAALSPLYPYPGEVSLADPRFLGPLAAVIAISAACIGLSRRHKAFAAAWVSFIALLLPMLGIVQIGPHLVADRYAYLSSIGPFLLCGLGASWGWEQAPPEGHARAAWRFATAASCAAALVALSLLTARQISVWEDSISLWRAVLGRNRGDYIAHTNLGTALAAKGKAVEAVEHFRTAVGLSPLASRAHYNLAQILAARGASEEAIPHYRAALETDPTLNEARNSLGLALMAAGELAAAEAEFRRAMSLNPEDAVARFNLATVLARASRFLESALEFREVLRIEPENSEARARLDFLEQARPPAGLTGESQARPAPLRQSTGNGR